MCGPPCLGHHYPLAHSSTPHFDPGKRHSPWAACHLRQPPGAWQTDSHLSQEAQVDAGRQRRPRGLPTRDLQKPPSGAGCCLNTPFSYKVQTQRGKANAVGPSGTLQKTPHPTAALSTSFASFSCPCSAGCHLFGGGGQGLRCLWVGVEWEERCLAPRGAAEIYGTGFLQAGERPQAGAVEPSRGANA